MKEKITMATIAVISVFMFGYILLETVPRLENKNMILKAEISVLKETIENIAHCDKAEYCREEIEIALDLIRGNK